MKNWTWSSNYLCPQKDDAKKQMRKGLAEVIIVAFSKRERYPWNERGGKSSPRKLLWPLFLREIPMEEEAGVPLGNVKDGAGDDGEMTVPLPPPLPPLMLRPSTTTAAAAAAAHASSVDRRRRRRCFGGGGGLFFFFIHSWERKQKSESKSFVKTKKKETKVDFTLSRWTAYLFIAVRVGGLQEMIDLFFVRNKKVDNFFCLVGKPFKE